MNFGIEALLVELTKGNETLVMLLAVSALITISFAVELWVELKERDLDWNDVTEFGKPIILNVIFLLGTEILSIPAKNVPFAYEGVVAIQSLGWFGFMVYYFFGLYNNLKSLGLKLNEKAEKAVEDIIKGKENEEEEDNR